MNKEISVKLVVNNTFNDIDRFCLSHSIDIVRDLTELEGVLLNEQTGEIIEISELERVLGILDGILNSKEWTLK